MDQQINQIINQHHRMNRRLWMAILSGVLLIIAVTVLFHFSDVFTHPIVEEASTLNDIMFVIIVVVVLAILAVKRRLMDTKKILSKANITLLSDGQGESTKDPTNRKAEILQNAIQFMRQNFLIIWVLGEVVVIIGFILYILLLNFEAFLIYSIVGLWSLAVNYPRLQFLQRLYYLIEEN
ncbi:MAG: hypothetical protein GF313_07795 [Caldithrix sp.]|nr:hypothetical protein [Caldithrix sp.]